MATRSGAKLHCLEAGDPGAAVTAILVHGMGNNAAVWLKMMPLLQPQFRCIAPDLPHHGYSEGGDAVPGIPCFAESLSELIDSLGPGPVVLIGHSMGGLTVIRTLLNGVAPNVKAFALLAPAGFETFTDKDKQWLKAIYAEWLLLKMTAGRMKDQLKENFFDFPDDFGFALDDLDALRGSPADFKAYCATLSKCMHSILDTPVFDLMPSLDLPCLVFFGEQDGVIPNRILHPAQTGPLVAEAGTRQIPGAGLHLIPECGHMLQWEAAGFISEKLLEGFSTIR